MEGSIWYSIAAGSVLVPLLIVVELLEKLQVWVVHYWQQV